MPLTPLHELSGINLPENIKELAMYWFTLYSTTHPLRYSLSERRVYYMNQGYGGWHMLDDIAFFISSKRNECIHMGVDINSLKFADHMIAIAE